MIDSSSMHDADSFLLESDIDRKYSSTLESQRDLPLKSSSRNNSAPNENFCGNLATFLQKPDECALNLTCKRKEQNDSFSKKTSKSCRSPPPVFETTFKSNNPTIDAADKLKKLSTSAVERMYFRCQEQLVASNNFARAIMQKRLQEEMSSALFTAAIVGQYKNQWTLFANSSLTYKRALFDNIHENTFNRENLNERKEFEEITNKQHCVGSPSSLPASPLSLPSPSLADDAKIRLSPNFFSADLEEANLQFPTSSKTNSDEVNVLSTEESSLSPFPVLPLKASKKQRYRPRRFANPESDSNGNFYQCSICRACYPHKFELNRHIKVSHVRPHRCNQCGKGFGHRNYLKVHIETVHMGHKSHQCRLCGKYLSTGGNLNVHVRTIHLGEKNYICPVCKRSFGQQCNMKTHMKRHFTKSVDET